MRVNSKIILAFVLATVMVFSIVSPAFAAPPPTVPVELPENVPIEIDYVAMGDSGAAGVGAVSDAPYPGALSGWEKKSKLGYTDLISKWLTKQGAVGFFDEKYCISGNTAAELKVQSASDYAIALLH